MLHQKCGDQGAQPASMASSRVRLRSKRAASRSVSGGMSSRSRFLVLEDLTPPVVTIHASLPIQKPFLVIRNSGRYRPIQARRLK